MWVRMRQFTRKTSFKITPCKHVLCLALLSKLFFLFLVQTNSDTTLLFAWNWTEEMLKLPQRVDNVGRLAGDLERTLHGRCRAPTHRFGPGWEIKESVRTGSNSDARGINITNPSWNRPCFVYETCSCNTDSTGSRFLDRITQVSDFKT